jgi:hypothetical protein
MTTVDCERLHEIAPELALGIADGEDRARALDHLADCAACRAHVERLSAVADELLLLSPSAEPPPGFEERVIGSAPGPPPRRSFWRRVAIPAFAAVTAAAAAGFVVWSALGDDRDLADSYRETLAVANGEYFDAADLEAPGGEKVGYVYGYQGRASWVLAVIYDGVRDGTYRLGLVSADGKRWPLRGIDVSDGRGSEGAVTPIPYDEVSEVRLLAPGGRELAEADIHD